MSDPREFASITRLAGAALPLLAAVALAAGLADAAPRDEPVGVDPAEALRLGERMYRDGVLPDGTLIRGVVQGDVPVDGRMLSCATCHLRSGMGSLEGSIPARGVTGPALFQPLRRIRDRVLAASRNIPERLKGEPLRPAYTESSLARALREGVDPSGRRLSDAMPRYPLGDRDVQVLSSYLRGLSAEPSPGADAAMVRFGVVIGDGAAPGEREAMLSVLEAHVRDINAQPRRQEERIRRGGFLMKESYVGFRRLELVRYRLQGPPETWRRQLEEQYRAEPVFALLGGISGGDWEPVHRFCEDNRIPCLFPLTDEPVLSDRDWYTLYLSKGLFQEGESAARFLAREIDITSGTRVVQVYVNHRPGRALARGFRETWTRLGRREPESVVVQPGDQVPDRELPKLLGSVGDSVVLAWLDGAHRGLLESLAAGAARPRLLMVSWSRMGSVLASLSPEARQLTYATYPRTLPSDERERSLAVEHWLRIRSISATSPEIQSKMYFLGWMLAGALSQMRGAFYRDYFLDALDMMPDQTSSIVAYPRVSFGPGQRHAAKGCYVVQPGEGAEPQLQVRGDWVAY